MKNQEVDYKDSVCPFSFAVGDSSFAKDSRDAKFKECGSLKFIESKQHESPQETIQALDIVLRDAPSKCHILVDCMQRVKVQHGDVVVRQRFGCYGLTGVKEISLMLVEVENLRSF
ncbi:hypothetical protein G4B88_003607 [Cannabis sativa]|uniref:Uncharacterized protein n=1 Tax=Cannabis sativa TaxID=3483 RepID=A0A7J6FB61_CANSA|nr:hypothetical protein G4B88_003607 [Cannabis sativa]